MVSLNPQNNGIGGGAISFDDRSTLETERIISEHTPLISGIEENYRRIRTIPIIVIHILLMIIFELLIVLFPFLCYDKNFIKICAHHSAYNISLYIHVCGYFGIIIFDRIYHYYHDLSRRDGYLEFYRQTKNVRRTPLIVISTGNAILVAMIKLLEDYQSSILPLQPWHFLALLTTIEVIIIIGVLVWYLVKTIRFNKQQIPPDAAFDDLLSSLSGLQTPTNEIGFRDETFTEHVLEKQADLIAYLRERNTRLTLLLQRYQQQASSAQISTNII